MVTPAIAKPPVPTKFPLRSPRGAVLATRVWSTPKTPVVAVCLLVHGGGWHSGYFEELARELTKKGIYCAAYGQPSHGYSEPEPGAPAGCIHVQDFSDLAEDVVAGVDWARKEAQVDTTVPLYLFGESFGGPQVLLAALDAADYQCDISGVIVSGALMAIGDGLLPPAIVVSLLSYLAPYYPKLPMPATDLSATYDEAFGSVEWAKVTRSDAYIQVSPHPALGSVVAMLSAGKNLQKRAKELDIPLLAIHAIQDCRTKCSAVQHFVAAAPRAEGMWVDDTTGHQLLQDRPEVTQRVMTKIADWIVQQAARSI